METQNGPAGAKLFDGVWLPENEEHLVQMMTMPPGHPLRLPDGRPTYQRHKYLALMEHVPADRRRVFVDIGAHVGLWSMQATLDFDVIYAFEPVPLHADLYHLNLPGGGTVMHRVALGAKPGRVAMVSEGVSSGDMHIRGDGDIPMRMLDHYELLQPDVIKIDVEGYELPVLQGAVQTIKRTRPFIVIEQKAKERDNFGWGHQEALQFLIGLGMVEIRPNIAQDHFLGWPS